MIRSELLWMGNALVLLHLFPGILAWGKDGHYAVCKIAEVRPMQRWSLTEWLKVILDWPTVLSLSSKNRPNTPFFVYYCYSFEFEFRMFFGKLFGFTSTRTNILINVNFIQGLKSSSTAIYAVM